MIQHPTMEQTSYKTLTKSNVKETTQDGLTLTVTDVNVKMRPDDAAYQRSKELWQHVPRGCATIVVMDKNVLWQGSIMGFPKFGYEEDKMYQFPHKASDVDSFVFVTKENGECFHFTCSPKMSWGRVVAFGSKQVHVATIFAHDEDFYTMEWIQPLQTQHYPDPRYGYAFQLIAQMVQEAKSSELIQRQWTSMLDELVNCTAIAEACDPQRAEHLVHYDSPQLLWLGWRRGTDMSFLSSHPAEQRARFQSWGWKVPFEFVSVMAQNMEKIKFIQEHFRLVENCEGAVKYVVLKDGRTVAFVKDKNYNYVARRAVREKVKQGVSSRGLRRRIEDLHVPYTPEFLQYSLRFNAWVQLQRRAGALSSEDIDAHYMTVEKKFQCVDDDRRQAAQEEWERIGSDSKLILVLGAPCQGCGKTRLGLTLTYIMNQLGVNAVHVSQDDCKGQRKLFLQQVEDHSKDKGIQVIVIDKYNDESNRRDYKDLDGQKVFIGFHHPNDGETDQRRVHLINHCLMRVTERKNSHLSLRASDMPKEELVSLLTAFSSKWKFPEEGESFSARISLSVLDSTEKQVGMVFKELQRAHLLGEVDWPRHVSGGLEFHRKYETKCAQQKSISKPKSKPKVTLYWKIELDSEPLRDLWKSIESKSNVANYGLQPSFHVTLAFFKGKVDDQVDKAWIPREGEEVKVVLDRVLHDDKCWAVGVKDDPTFHPHTSHLHVTLARKADVAPAYARQLLEDSSVSSFPLSVPLVVSGTIQRVTK